MFCCCFRGACSLSGLAGLAWLTELEGLAGLAGLAWQGWAGLASDDKMDPVGMEGAGGRDGKGAVDPVGMEGAGGGDGKGTVPERFSRSMGAALFFLFVICALGCSALSILTSGRTFCLEGASSHPATGGIDNDVEWLERPP